MDLPSSSGSFTGMAIINTFCGDYNIEYTFCCTNFITDQIFTMPQFGKISIPRRLLGTISPTKTFCFGTKMFLFAKSKGISIRTDLL